MCSSVHHKVCRIVNTARTNEGAALHQLDDDCHPLFEHIDGIIIKLFEIVMMTAAMVAVVDILITIVIMVTTMID